MKRTRAALWLVILLFLMVTACKSGSDEESDATAVAEATASAESAAEAANAPVVSRTPRPSRTPQPDDDGLQPTPTIRGTGAAQVLDERGRPLIEVNAASINVRREPNIESEAFAYLYEGDTVAILATSDDGAWFQVELDNGRTGWVSEAVVIPLTDKPFFPTATPTITPTFMPGQIGARVIFSSIHLRTGPGTEFAVLRYMFENEGVIITGRNEAGDWYFVETRSGRTGWLAAFVVEIVTGDSEDEILVVTEVP